jgi:hypothetical protein
LLFDDGRMYSAHPCCGTRYTTPGILSANQWDILMIPTVLEQDIYIQAFCEHELGCKYDWKGIWFSQIIKMHRSHPDQWFCSEFCTAALQTLHLLVGAKPCTFSPGKLYKRLRESGAIVCAQ